MVYDSVYEMTNYLRSTVRKQHFWDYFSGAGISFTTQSAYNYTGGSENSGNIYGGSSTKMYGQKLDSGHSGIGKVIVKVDTPVKKYGSPTGTATIRVYAGDGTTILAESSGLDVSTLTTSYVNKSFVLSPRATLETNSRVVIYYSGGDSSNYINIGVGDVGGAGSNTSSTRWDGSNWASPTTRDTKMTFDSLPSSQVIPSNRWTYHNLSGTNTPRISNSVDGGYEIASAGANGNQACIDFNDRRHYSPRGAVCIGVARSPDLTTGSDGVSYNVGFIEDKGHSFDVGASLNFAMSFSYGGFTHFSLHSGNPTEAGSYLDSTTAIDNNWHVHQVETLPTGTRLSIDGIMGAIKTTKLPESTAKFQPRFDMREGNTGGAVHLTAIRYMEAYNT